MRAAKNGFTRIEVTIKDKYFVCFNRRPDLGLIQPDSFLSFSLNVPIPASFCSFSSFSHYTIQQIDESIDGVLGTRTWVGRMEGADKST